MTHIYEHEICSKCGKSVGVTVNGIVVRHNNKKGEICPACNSPYWNKMRVFPKREKR